MKIIDTKGRYLKQFAAMSRPKNSRGVWNYMYFWAANQKEAESYYNNQLLGNYFDGLLGEFIDYKLERIKEKK